MSKLASSVLPPASANFMYIVGAVVLVCVAFYFLFMAVDGWGLADRKGTARILAKGYKEAGKTYITQIVAGRPVVLPQAKPEMYLLKLDIDGKETECVVEKSLYDAVNPEDEIQVVYQKRRILGSLQVVKVTR
jgi:hypothetical protein